MCVKFVIVFGCIFCSMLAVAASLQAQSLIWSRINGEIQRSNLNGGNIETLFTGLINPVDLEVNDNTGGIYWVSYAGSPFDPNISIYTGIDTSPIVTNLRSFSNSTDLAIDESTGEIYWLEDAVLRMNANGSNVTQVSTIGSAAGGPIYMMGQGIEFNSAQTDLYWNWVDLGQPPVGTGPFGPIPVGATFCNDLQGGDPQHLSAITTNAGKMAIDTSASKLYWTEVDFGRIVRADLDGTNRQVLIDDLPPTLGDLEIDESNDKIYWSLELGGDGKIQRANLDGSNVEDVVTGILGVRGIAVSQLINDKIVWSGDIIPADPTNWTSSTAAYVGYSGTGTLDIMGGGAVISGNGHIGYEIGSTGEVTVDGTSPVDGESSTWTNSERLYVGRSGSGTLNITGGGAVSNSHGYIGDESGSTGEVTVDGADSTWTNSERLYVGRSGSGTLNITDDGEVTVERDTLVFSSYSGSSGTIRFDNGTLTTGGLRCSIDDLTGTGTINTHGLVSDVDLVFDVTHGLNQTFNINDNSGQNITVNLDVDGSGSMGAGYSGVGTMSISDGIIVPSTDGYIGYKSGSTGEVTVDGADSTWTNSERLYVGRSGSGTLNITGGGEVSISHGYIGYGSGSTGEVTVDGADSTWTNSETLYVGESGGGTLNITGGGEVSISHGYIGYGSGSTGEVTVDGAESTWTNSSSLYVGYIGSGTLNITGGGAVSNGYGYLGFSSTGEVTVDGTSPIDGKSSMWTNSEDLYVGYFGSGTLNITSGGLVSVAGTLTIDNNGNGDGFINMATGGMLALYGEADGSINDFMNLINGTDAIRYWNDDISDWADITGATYGDDYTLSYLTEGDFDGDGDIDGADFLKWQRGELPNPLSSSDLANWQANFGSDLAGYTVLTVYTPKPSPDLDDDGDVDGNDFLAWQRGASPIPLSGFDLYNWESNFGTIVNSIAATSTGVPEPSTLLLSLLGLSAVCTRPRRFGK